MRTIDTMTLSPHAGLRGPAEHERREQILAAADTQFRHYGYSKTTVADIAKAIGLSTAYIYKFFESKQAIGETTCDRCLSGILAKLQVIADEDKPASDRLRRIMMELTRQVAELLFHERKMFDIVSFALGERWSSVARHEAGLFALVRRIVQEGRESGEFERKTPLEETCRAIMLALEPVRVPPLLERRFDTLEADTALVAGLILRSLTA